LPVFRVPPLPPGAVLPLSPVRDQTPLQQEVVSSLPPPPPIPAKPLAPERIEMAILWYEEQKREWLSSHPDVWPADYRKAQGFKKLQNLGRF